MKTSEKNSEQEQSLAGTLRGLYGHFSTRRRVHLLILVVLMLAGAIAELLTLGAVVPFVALMAEPERAYDYPRLQQLFETVGWHDPESILLPMTALFVALAVVASAIRLALLWVKNQFVFGLGYDIGVRLYEKILHQPYSYHVARNSSEVIAGVTKVQQAINGVLQPMLDAMVALILGAGLITALLIIDASVAFIGGLIFGALYFLVTVITRLRLKRNSKIIARAQSDRIRCIQEGLGGIRDIILDGGHEHYLKSFSRVDRRLRIAQASNSFLGQAPRFLIEALGIMLVVGFAYFLVLQPGGLVAALPVLGALALGAQRLLPLLQQMYNGWSRMMGNKQVLIDVLGFLSLPLAKPGHSACAIPFHSMIELQDVGFRYSSQGPPVLSSLNLTIRKGEKIGLIGKTGSGKTTAMDLVMGLLHPSDGWILVDGQKLSKDTMPSWQQLIAHVPQAIYLADASLAENIAFGIPRSDIDMDRVRLAASRAQIADYIESKPDGYETTVGERGIQLSGGQRQRVGIARALYKNAKVLVFDEATSALDNQTEAAIMEAIENLDQDLTVLIVAHRLGTLSVCDRVLELQEGRVVKEGSFEQVINRAGEQHSTETLA